MRKRFLREGFSKSNKLKLFLIAILLFWNQCGNKISDEEKILNLYSDLAVEYNKENLRGIMKPVSKKFQTSMDNYRDYEDVKRTTAMILLRNRNIYVDFLNFEINITDNKADVKYNMRFTSDQYEYEIKKADYLEKKWGNWKIISWEFEN